MHRKQSIRLKHKHGTRKQQERKGNEVNAVPWNKKKKTQNKNRCVANRKHT